VPVDIKNSSFPTLQLLYDVPYARQSFNGCISMLPA